MIFRTIPIPPDLATEILQKACQTLSMFFGTNKEKANRASPAWRSRPLPSVRPG
jgi:hypothetical protein